MSASSSVTTCSSVGRFRLRRRSWSGSVWLIGSTGYCLLPQELPAAHRDENSAQHSFAVLRAGVDRHGSTDPHGSTGFMDMPVQRDQWLDLLDGAANGGGSDGSGDLRAPEVSTERSGFSIGAVSMRELYGGTWMLNRAVEGFSSRSVIALRRSAISVSVYSRWVFHGVWLVYPVLSISCPGAISTISPSTNRKRSSPNSRRTSSTTRGSSFPGALRMTVPLSASRSCA